MVDGYGKAGLATDMSVRGAENLEETTPPIVDIEQRIAMATRCHDADGIAKVAEAGTVRREPDGTLVQIMHNGLKVVADGYYGSWMTRLIGLCRGHHEPQEERAFYEVMRLVPPSASMIEVGGFWAYYTLWFLKDAPGRTATVIEPDPAHLSIGRHNAALNGASPLFRPGFIGRTPAPPLPFLTESSGLVALPRLSVPQVMEEQGLSRLDVLHCDAQGAELDVLESCEALFRSDRIQWVFVSTHAHQITGDPLTHQRCLAVLRRSGAVIEAEHEVHESFTGDGLIVARFGPAPEGWRGPIPISHNRYSESLFRNPAYDLARALRRGPEREQVERTVRALYRMLLLREPDPAGLAAHSDDLERTGDIEASMTALLASAEFAGVQDTFLDRHVVSGHRAEQQRLAAAGRDQRYFTRYLGDDGTMAASGLRLTLKEDGPLGRKGETLLAPLDRVMLPEVYKAGAWQTEDVDFARDRMQAGVSYTLLDIGANIGLFSRQFLEAFPAIERCCCAEPDPANFDALSHNLRRFGDRARLFNVALGTQSGRQDFFRDLENAGNYSLNKDAVRDRPFERSTVATVAAEDWLRDAAGLSGPLIWKSDTQGFDEVIISRAPCEVWTRVQFAIIELWRIEKPGFDRAEFARKIAAFPGKFMGIGNPVSTETIMDYLSGQDWTFSDLYLWR